MYLNPSTSGLCAGGGNGGGTGGGSGGGNGGSNGAGDSGGSQTPTPQNGTPAPQDDDPKDAPVSSPQVYQLAATLVVNNLSSSSSSSSSLSSASITPSVTPSSATTTSSQANPAPQVADCASGVGLLGKPSTIPSFPAPFPPVPSFPVLSVRHPYSLTHHFLYHRSQPVSTSNPEQCQLTLLTSSQDPPAKPSATVPAIGPAWAPRKPATIIVLIESIWDREKMNDLGSKAWRSAHVNLDAVGNFLILSST